MYQHSRYPYPAYIPAQPPLYSSTRLPDPDSYRHRGSRRSSTQTPQYENTTGSAAMFSNTHTSPVMQRDNYSARARSRHSSPTGHYQHAPNTRHPSPSRVRTHSRSSFRSRAPSTPSYYDEVLDSCSPNAPRQRSQSPSQWEDPSVSETNMPPRGRSRSRSPSTVIYYIDDAYSDMPRQHSPRSGINNSSLRPRSRTSFTYSRNSGRFGRPSPSPPRSPSSSRRSSSSSSSRSRSTRIIHVPSRNESEYSEYLPEYRPENRYQRDIIGSEMPIIDVIECLVRNGCTDLSWDLAHYEPEPYSHGGLGVVHRGSLRDGTKVALKCLRSYIAEGEPNRKALKNTARELFTWSQCKHPNVVALLGLVELRGKLAMVSPWMKRGGVDHLNRTDRRINRCRLSAQIAKGLSYLHKKGIVHGDLKGANVLLSNDDVAQLADFGNAVIESSVLTFTQSSTRGCSVRWAAPEQLEDHVSCSFEADVYSLGMTILEVISRELPFTHIRNQAAIITAITRGQIPNRPESTIPTASKQGDILWRLLTECWIGKPERRPSAPYVELVMKRITTEGLAPHRPDYPTYHQSSTGYTQHWDSSRSTRQTTRERTKETETRGRRRSGSQPQRGYYTG